MDDVEIYYFNGEQVKAFYTGYGIGGRSPSERYAYELKLERQREISRLNHIKKLTIQQNIYRQYVIRNSKRANAMKSLMERAEKKQAAGG